MLPCTKTIERHWGWNELLAEPSGVLVQWGVDVDDRVQAMVTGLRAARDQPGHWPTAAAWTRGAAADVENVHAALRQLEGGCGPASERRQIATAN